MNATNHHLSVQAREGAWRADHRGGHDGQRARTGARASANRRAAVGRAELTQRDQVWTGEVREQCAWYWSYQGCTLSRNRKNEKVQYLLHTYSG